MGKLEKDVGCKNTPTGEVSPALGEGLLILCHHGVWGACLIFHWVMIET